MRHCHQRLALVQQVTVKRCFRLIDDYQVGALQDFRWHRHCGSEIDAKKAIKIIGGFTNRLHRNLKLTYQRIAPRQIKHFGAQCAVRPGGHDNLILS